MSDAGTRPVRTVFLGSGGFAVPILEALLSASEVELVGVVSAPDRPSGRHRSVASTPVAARARVLGFPLLQPGRIRDPDAIAAFAELQPELGVLADYGRIVPPAILDLPAHGILNLHPSLLPRHRGASPIPATIVAGDAETGVSLIRMDAGLDTGPVIATTRWPLTGAELAPDLEARAAEAGADLLRRSLQGWIDGSLPAIPQDDAAASLTRPLGRHDGRLDPSQSAAALERQVRAYQPWPGSHLETSIGRIAIWRATVGDARPEGVAPGRLAALGDSLALAAMDRWLVLDEVQVAAGRRMSGPDFLRGRGRALISSAGGMPAG